MLYLDMRKVLLKNGNILEVDNNEAHRLIDQEGAQLVTPTIQKSQYSHRMMTTSKGENYVTKRKRSNHS